MRLFTKTVKVFGLTPHEADVLHKLVLDAIRGENMKEHRVGANTYMAVDVDQKYAPMSEQRKEDGLDFPPAKSKHGKDTGTYVVE